MTVGQQVPLDHIATALSEQIADARRKQGKKPTALNTPLRFSSAAKCARQLGYEALEHYSQLDLVTDPSDEATQFAAWMGEQVHLAQQAAVEITESHAEWSHEYVGGDENWSGSGDSLATFTNSTGDTFKVAYEYKTRSQYLFEDETGIKRRKRGRDSTGKMVSKPGRVKAHGPKVGTMLQVGMAMKFAEADEARVIAWQRDAFSLRAGLYVEMTPNERIQYQWSYHPEQILHMVEQELSRGAMILDMLNMGDGVLPERIEPVLSLAGEGEYKPWHRLLDDPDSMNQLMPCWYCNFKTQCQADGGGEISVDITLGNRKKL